MKISCKCAKRRGAVMIASLVIVSLVAISAVVLAQEQLRIRRQALRESHASQAQWLAEGALQRAQAAAAVDPNYAGETWTANLDWFGEPLAGEARIEVRSQQDAPDEKMFYIKAQFPVDPIFGVQHELIAPFPSKADRP